MQEERPPLPQRPHLQEDASTAVNFIERPRAKRLQRTLRKAVAGILIFLLVTIGARRVQHSLKPANASGDPLVYDPVTLEPKRPTGLLSKITQVFLSEGDELIGGHEDRVNVLLLGIGGAGHDGPYLTDTIIVVSMKPSTREVAMISLPRDLAVNIPGHGVYKINSASAFGEAEKPGWGGAKTTAVVEKTLGLRIPYYARVDFAAFKDIIDAAGGIPVHVERSFVDTMYPGPANTYRTISFTQGMQTMDGETALEYARSRHGSSGEGSDFARARRQQKMLLGLKQKLMAGETLTNPLKINHIVQSLDTHMTTNMEFKDLLAVARLAHGLRFDEIQTLVLDTSAGGYLAAETSMDGAFLLYPASGDFADIRTAVYTIFNPDAPRGALRERTKTVATKRRPAGAPRIEIQNGTWRAGLAARIKKRLEDKTFLVETLGNTLVRPVPQSGVYQLSVHSSAETAKIVAETLGIPLQDALPPQFTPAGDPDILIILGVDLKE